MSSPTPAQVLVVDDSPIDRHLVGGLLKQRPDLRVQFATNGEEALAAIEAAPPDVLLTDLQMPVLDGLSLVQQVRERFPFVPTILMTAHGSEEIAITALNQGAASYVPKRSLARQLVGTVVDVLAASRAGRAQRRLFECWQQTRFNFLLTNDDSLVPPLVAHLQQHLAASTQCDPTEVVRVGVALHEAIRNAIDHG
ncbi:MAG: response regulator, partial [Pirellulaceae bacterium]|nr:response regulator [Pirellulaceae bacterium]